MANDETRIPYSEGEGRTFELCRVRQLNQQVSITSMGGFGAQDSTKIAAIQSLRAISAFVEARFSRQPLSFTQALEVALLGFNRAASANCSAAGQECGDKFGVSRPPRGRSIIGGRDEPTSLLVRFACGRSITSRPRTCR